MNLVGVQHRLDHKCKKVPRFGVVVVEMQETLPRNHHATGRDIWPVSRYGIWHKTDIDYLLRLKEASQPDDALY